VLGGAGYKAFQPPLELGTPQGTGGLRIADLPMSRHFHTTFPVPPGTNTLMDVTMPPGAGLALHSLTVFDIYPVDITIEINGAQVFFRLGDGNVNSSRDKGKELIPAMIAPPGSHVRVAAWASSGTVQQHLTIGGYIIYDTDL